jgi:hypothetical protein
MKARTPFLMLAAIALLASCSTEQLETPNNPQEETGKVYLEVTAAQPATPETRMTYTEDDGKATGHVGMKVEWSGDELLGVASYSHADGGVMTPKLLDETLEAGEAGPSTIFAGTVESSLADLYNFYYPAADGTIGVMDKTAKTVTYDYTGQRTTLAQKGKTEEYVGNPDAMSSLDVLYTTQAANPSAGIDLHRASAILRFDLTLPADAPAIETIYLNASSAVFYEKLTLTFSDANITPTGVTPVSTIRLAVTDDDIPSGVPIRTIKTYMLTPGGITIPAGTVVTVSAAAADGTTYSYSFSSLATTGATLDAGKTYTFAPASPLSDVSLSTTEETANSYIIQTANTKYSFDASVRGNGSTLPSISAFPFLSRTIPSNSGNTVSVLWSMGGSDTKAADGIVKDVTYDASTERISFTSGSSTTGGNAVIVLKDDEDVVLWSWHIWMNAAFDPSKDQDYTTASIDYYGGTVKMMPYNLGAVNTSGTAIADKPYNDGLLYQWGRKDPFLGGADYNIPNNAEPAAGTDYYMATTTTFTTAAGPVAPSVAYGNPTTFYTRNNIISKHDWADANYLNLWGNGSDTYADWDATNNKKFPTKTLFDPCPPGYVVAPRNTWNSSAWNGFLNNGRTYQYDGTATTFYAASAYRSYDDGSLRNVGSFGNIWSSSPSQNGGRGGGYLTFTDEKAPQLSATYRSYGFSVRCARME